jgi:hypothetical protein
VWEVFVPPSFSSLSFITPTPYVRLLFSARFILSFIINFHRRILTPCWWSSIWHTHSIHLVCERFQFPQTLDLRLSSHRHLVPPPLLSFTLSVIINNPAYTPPPSQHPHSSRSRVIRSIGFFRVWPGLVPPTWPLDPLLVLLLFLEWINFEDTNVSSAPFPSSGNTKSTGHLVLVLSLSNKQNLTFLEPTHPMTTSSHSSPSSRYSLSNTQEKVVTRRDVKQKPRFT